MSEQRFNTDYIRENPEYIEILEKIIEHEESLDESDFEGKASLERFNENHDTEHTMYWRNTDIKAHPSKLYQLEVNGFLDRIIDSNSSTHYSMSHMRGDIKDTINNIKDQYDSDGFPVVEHDFPDEDELDGVFDDVVGYEDVKWLMKRAMSSEDIVNVLFVGPPGSAKTVFLMCIDKLESSEFISGKPTSGPGFMDMMFERKPKYVAIDELDDMEKDDQKNLSDYTENGILVETKGGGKARKMRTNTKTFAAANSRDSIINQIENRFTDLTFEPYTQDEFIEVCEHILSRNEGKTKSQARDIAHAIWDIEGWGNVRKAIQTARLSDGDPKKVLSVLDEYSGSKTKTLRL